MYSRGALNKKTIGAAAEANVSAKSKRKLREKQEDMILQKAINVMDKSVKKMTRTIF